MPKQESYEARSERIVGEYLKTGSIESLLENAEDKAIQEFLGQEGELDVLSIGDPEQMVNHLIFKKPDGTTVIVGGRYRNLDAAISHVKEVTERVRENTK